MRQITAKEQAKQRARAETTATEAAKNVIDSLAVEEEEEKAKSTGHQQTLAAHLTGSVKQIMRRQNAAIENRAKRQAAGTKRTHDEIETESKEQADVTTNQDTSKAKNDTTTDLVGDNRDTEGGPPATATPRKACSGSAASSSSKNSNSNSSIHNSASRSDSDREQLNNSQRPDSRSRRARKTTSSTSVESPEKDEHRHQMQQYDTMLWHLLGCPKQMKHNLLGHLKQDTQRNDPSINWNWNA